LKLAKFHITDPSLLWQEGLGEILTHPDKLHSELVAGGDTDLFLQATTLQGNSGAAAKFKKGRGSGAKEGSKTWEHKKESAEWDSKSKPKGASKSCFICGKKSSLQKIALIGKSSNSSRTPLLDPWPTPELVASSSGARPSSGYPWKPGIWNSSGGERSCRATKLLECKWSLAGKRPLSRLDNEDSCGRWTRTAAKPVDSLAKKHQISYDGRYNDSRLAGRCKICTNLQTCRL
jgi:hypothetical protein